MLFANGANVRKIGSNGRKWVIALKLPLRCWNAIIKFTCSRNVKHLGDECLSDALLSFNWIFFGANESETWWFTVCTLHTQTETITEYVPTTTKNLPNSCQQWQKNVVRSILFTVFHHQKEERARDRGKKWHKQKPKGIESKYSLFHSMLIPKYYLYSVHDARTAVPVTTLNSHWHKTCPKLNCINNRNNNNSDSSSNKRKNPQYMLHQMRPAVAPASSNNTSAQKPFRICLLFLHVVYALRYICWVYFRLFFCLHHLRFLCYNSGGSGIDGDGFAQWKAKAFWRVANIGSKTIAIVVVENRRRLELVAAMMPREKVLYN